MTDDRAVPDNRELTAAVMRLGGASAIAGAVISVAAGASFANATEGASGEEILSFIASRPAGLWEIANLGFIVGALLWLVAFGALTFSLRGGSAWLLSRIGLAAVIVGTALHAVDASINGAGLGSLAAEWESATSGRQAALATMAATLLTVLTGTWASVITFFHGVPFVLFGLAVAFSSRFPAWLGWIGLLGGAGSIVAGLLMFLGAPSPEGAYVPFAVLLSLWMVVLGVYLWRQAGTSATEAGRAASF